MSHPSEIDAVKKRVRDYWYFEKFAPEDEVDQEETQEGPAGEAEEELQATIQLEEAEDQEEKALREVRLFFPKVFTCPRN